MGQKKRWKKGKDVDRSTRTLNNSSTLPGTVIHWQSTLSIPGCGVAVVTSPHTHFLTTSGWVAGFHLVPLTRIRINVCLAKYFNTQYNYPLQLNKEKIN